MVEAILGVFELSHLVETPLVHVQRDVLLLAELSESRECFLGRLSVMTGIGRHSKLFLGVVVHLALAQIEWMEEDVARLEKGRQWLVRHVE